MRYLKKGEKLFISSSLVTAIMFAPVWSESTFAYANPDESNRTENSITEESTEPSQSNILIKRNDRGSEVRKLQSSLNTLGYSIQVDGIFGPDTESILKMYQEDQGLIVDGIAGPNTYRALGSNSIEESSPSNEDTTNEEQASSSKIVATAKSVLGTPYLWGGTTPDGLDSSGFINYVFSQNGIDVSRTHAEMWRNDGVRVETLNVGDVLFYEGTYDTAGASHSGIYIGNNQMIHAGAQGVVTADITSDYWQSHFIGIKSFK
ncbi:NlpC/P60 family protein [Geomicrobium sediminis]|uniref:Cell wall-associated NlpC family hydrolase n=1 Tax=Geomicrobium sediminis TaxID=1347788 RepID=A0ABS2PFZ1_9BACL|nr:NlpC/P60 family protein [Geomicrobium sediminis]EZH64206.1 hypothetical protein DH09_00265 [Bacillaceae bacterium JMAK1]MBM7634271.1 cell wall-associated NlpC family hydrolase [Geomicrobium sediminis]